MLVIYSAGLILRAYVVTAVMTFLVSMLLLANYTYASFIIVGFVDSVSRTDVRLRKSQTSGSNFRGSLASRGSQHSKEETSSEVNNEERPSVIQGRTYALRNLGSTVESGGHSGLVRGQCGRVGGCFRDAHVE